MSAEINWATGVPPNILEDILFYAINGEDGKYGQNVHAERMLNYALVHPTWKNTILASRGRLFNEDIGSIDICYSDVYSAQTRDVVPTEFIGEGLLSVAKGLRLTVERNVDLGFLRDILSKGNSIQYFTLTLQWHRHTSRTFRQAINIVESMERAHTYTISVEVYSQQQAELVWEMFLVGIQNNDRPKRLKIMLHVLSKRYEPNIDWNFTESNRSLAMVEQLEVVSSWTQMKWSDLAEIDKIKVHWTSLVIASYNTNFVRTKAKRLEIEVPCFGDRLKMLRMLRNGHFIDASLLNVTEITCVYNHNFKKTFHCKRTVWADLDEWLVCLSE